MAEPFGGLHSHAAYDKSLMDTINWKTEGRLRPTWMREVFVYPSNENGVFEKGKDAVDAFDPAFKDVPCKQWVFPASCIPKEVIGQRGIGLYVDPGIGQETIEETENRIVVLPKSIIILSPILQFSDWGKADPATGMPLAIPIDSNEQNNRYLWRIEGKGLRFKNTIEAGVRPLVRTCNDGWSNRWDVIANARQDSELGVTAILKSIPLRKGMDLDGKGSLSLRRQLLPSTGDVSSKCQIVKGTIESLDNNVNLDFLEPLRRRLEIIGSRL